MDDSAAASLLAETASYAPSTLERATLSRQSHSIYTSRCEKETTTKPQLLNPGESSAFWAIVVILLVIAVGNLLLTLFAMGVLRLGYGMESMEFIPNAKLVKFYGLTDLGKVVKKDGVITGYSDNPFTITGVEEKVSFSVRAKDNPPTFEVGPNGAEITNVPAFKVIDPFTGQDIFSTSFPNFGLPEGVKNLIVKSSATSRITSGSSADLKINSDSMVRLKGSEGIHFDGKKSTWTADQDIYLKSINGSLTLEAGNGIFIEVNTLPLASPVDLSKDRGQYKLCLCLPQKQLFRVPVPSDNDRRHGTNRIDCASFTNPCRPKY